MSALRRSVSFWFDGGVGRDWIAWHGEYATRGSSLARRLEVVRAELRSLLGGIREAGGEPRLISMCAGDGRDVLPVLAECAVTGGCPRALLVELDPKLSATARETATKLGLSGVDIRTGDAGLTSAYSHFAPVHVVLACGVFGNISVEDARRTVAALPDLLCGGGAVIWTRGRGDSGRDPSYHIRGLFAAHGFTEVSFTAPTDARFRVGVHRLAASPSEPAPLGDGGRMFSFIR